ncbi:MAG: hypothetical protein KC593_10935 [Myxococcales bacterium]|nr:hypothetical protein [Myxococcales bacterium]
MPQPPLAARQLHGCRSPHAWALLACLALAGCGARQGGAPETATSEPTSETQAGGASVALEPGMTTEGAAGGAQPTDEAAAPSLADEDAFDALTETSAEYDVMLSAGGVDCGDARQLVERICYLATRVCALASSRVSEDALDQSQCHEGRVRCEDAEQRLRAACPASR